MMIRASVFWCKFDKLRDKYRPEQGKEWSIDAANITKEDKLALKSAGVLGRVKNKMDDRDDFLHFAVSEYQRPRRNHPTGKYEVWDFNDGSFKDALDHGFTARKNDVPPIFKADGKTLWNFTTDGPIGNGSVADFKFNISAPNVYLVAVRIRELVQYEGADNNREDPNDWGEYVKDVKKKTAKEKDSFEADFGMDDDMPL